MFDIIMSCQRRQKIYIRQMNACARQSLIDLRQRCRAIGERDDLRVSDRGFDIATQKLRRRRLQEIVDLQSMDWDAEGRLKRASLLSDLAIDLTRLMGGRPAEEVPLAHFSRKALAIYRGGNPPSDSQEGGTAAPSRSSGQGNNSPASPGSTFNRITFES